MVLMMLEFHGYICANCTYGGWFVAKEEWFISQQFGQDLQIVFAEFLDFLRFVYTDALCFEFFTSLEPLNMIQPYQHITLRGKWRQGNMEYGFDDVNFIVFQLQFQYWRTHLRIPNLAITLYKRALVLQIDDAGVVHQS